jgi:Polyphosphate kinase
MNFRPTDVINGMLNFNKRIMSEGTPDENTNYSMREFRQKLFFTHIAYENLQELFQRWAVSYNKGDYLAIVQRYLSNMIEFITRLRGITNYNYTRMDDCIPAIVESTGIQKHLVTETLRPEFPFRHKKIYYITESRDGYIIHSMKKASDLYKRITEDLLKEEIICKADDAVIQYLNKIYGEGSTFAIRMSVYDYDSHITKMEVNPLYEGPELYLDICEDIDRDAFIFENPIIFSDDILQWFAYFDLTEIKYVQEIPNLSFISIMNEDQLHAYPETSFDAYMNLLEDAANSSVVSSIKILLYRIGKDSKLIDLLCTASRNGKFIHVNLEMEAFGEQINARWKQELEDAGVYVTTYKRGELKVHAKATLITFVNGTRIAQIGTGNYNQATTTQYTDLSYYTSDPSICDEVDKLFRMLSGTKQEFTSEQFLVTRQNCKEVLLQKIREETWKKNDGYICIKCNALEDPDIIEALKDAEHAGCKMDIIVRGMNRFFPQQSSNRRIRQITYTWEKLEHSRVYCFGKDNPTIYLGSLDLVENKMENRIEILVLIDSIKCYQYLADYLNHYITNTSIAWKRVLGGSDLFVRNDVYLNLVKEYGQYMYDFMGE